MKNIILLTILVCILGCGHDKESEPQVIYIEIPAEPEVLLVIPMEHKIEVRINGTVDFVELQYNAGLPPEIVALPYSQTFTKKSGDFIRVIVAKTRTEATGEITVSIYIDDYFDWGKVSGTNAGAGDIWFAGYVLDQRVEWFFIQDYDLTPGLRERGLPTLLLETEAVEQYTHMSELDQMLWLDLNSSK